MIPVDKDFSRPPEILRGPGITNKIKDLLEKKSDHHFSGYFYRHKSVHEALLRLYKSKCGYCESKVGHASAYHVDHYRPKRGIKDETHGGYYWLAYEWSNLILCCERCNNAKSNQFPIAGKRVMEPRQDRAHWCADQPEYLEERPRLLNPEIDLPAKHLIFTFEGEIQTKGATYECLYSERVVKLNRAGLVLARRTKIDHFFNQIKDQTHLILSSGEQGKLLDKQVFQRELKLCFCDLFSRIESSSIAGQEFSLLGRQLYDRFAYFFTNRLKGDLARRIVEEALVLHKSGWEPLRL